MKSKATKTRRSSGPSCSEFWVIDTGAGGESIGTHEARGPFSSQKSAEDWIIRDTRAIWEDSCTCLTSDKSTKWCKPLHIVQVVRTVEPDITAKVTLIDFPNTLITATQQKPDAPK